MIKAIILDNEGVMIQNDWNRVARAVAGEFSLPPKSGEKFKDSLRCGHDDENNPLYQYVCGKISSADYWSLVLRSYGIPLTEQNRGSMSSKLELLTTVVNPDALEMVNRLKKSNYEVFLLSNATPEIVKGNISRHDYFSLFDRCYFSYQIGCRKPSPEAYLTVTNENRLSPAECYFIDDKEENVLAARKIGMSAERYKMGADRLVDILCQHIPLS